MDIAEEIAEVEGTEDSSGKKKGSANVKRPSTVGSRNLTPIPNLEKEPFNNSKRTSREFPLACRQHPA
jgi:hypothetical protein